MAQLMFKIADEQAPDILQYNPNLPQALAAFLDRTMTKELAERLQDGDTFAAALRETRGGAATAQPFGAGGIDISLGGSRFNMKKIIQSERKPPEPLRAGSARAIPGRR
jgi:hypothetical protein